MDAPTTSPQFDQAYRAPLTLWGDWRIPGEVKQLVGASRPGRALELGCGLGRISRYMVGQGLRVTGVDFSPMAIAQARARVAEDAARPDFLVDDVRELARVTGPFDLSIDIGCFHCLDADGQFRYVAALARLLRPGARHLLWVMDTAPSNRSMAAPDIGALFAPAFRLARFLDRRRRLVASRWFWMERAQGPSGARLPVPDRP